MASTAAEPLRLLIAEDDPAIRELLRVGLAGKGFDVVVAADGGHAIELIGRHCPQIVVTDFNLPNADGLDVCHAVRASTGGDVIPVLIVTAGDPSEGRIAEAVAIPGVMICRKPLRIRTLPVLLHALYEHWAGGAVRSADTATAAGEPAGDLAHAAQKSAAEAAEMVEDATRALPGEDSDTTDPGVAKRWVQTYQELLDYKRFMISQVEQRIAEANPDVQFELAATDLPFLRTEEKRFVKRLALWRTHLRDLTTESR